MADVGIVQYTAESGIDIKLSCDIVRQQFCPNATDKEALSFIALCRAHRMDPTIKDAYLVKYGNNANIIVGKDFFLKRAYRNPKFKGFRAGVLVYKLDADGNIVGGKEKEGSFIGSDEYVAGGWAEVFIEGWEHPLKETISRDEYDSGKSTWQKMPGTMCRKVALVHALREAFPEDFQGCYDESEMAQAIDVESNVE